MKRNLLIIASIFMMAASCEKNPNPTPTSDNVLVSGHLTEDTHWVDSVYEMVGKVVVDSGVTLTIDAGTLILAREGQGSSSSALIVSRGGMIDAVGTPLIPITFTSVLDGEADLDESDMGLWGGVVILGYGPISADAVPGNIEGIP